MSAAAPVLRPYQQRAVEQTVALLRARVRRAILQSPTGSGKTLIAAHVIQRALAKGSRVLFVAHRLELLTQPFRKLEEMGVPRAAMGVLCGADRSLRNLEAPLQIASAQTLDRMKGALPPAKLVIVDEAHRAGGPTYRRLLKAYGPDVTILGLTATPERLDGKPLDMFEQLVVVAKPSELIAQEFILEPEVWTVPAELLPDLRDVPAARGDFAPGALALAMERRELVGSIVEHWLRRARGLRTIAFASSVEHSRQIVAEFVAAGVRAAHVDAKTPKDERRALLERLGAGELDVLSNVDLLTEGVDIPSVKCVIMARPTESLTIFLQQIGRALRPWQGVGAKLLDHAGNVRRHGLPTDDREYSLTKGRGCRKSGDREEDTFACRTCPRCYMIVRAHVKTCPDCGHVFVSERREVLTVEGQLVAVTRAEYDARRAFWESSWRKAYAKGYRGGWVERAYRERFKEAPPGFPVPPRPPATDEDKAKFRKSLYVQAHIHGHPERWIQERYQNRFGEEMKTARG